PRPPRPPGPPRGAPPRTPPPSPAMASPSVPASSARCIIRTPLWSVIPLPPSSTVAVPPSQPSCGQAVTFWRVDPGAAQPLQPHRRLSHQDPQPYYGAPDTEMANSSLSVATPPIGGLVTLNNWTAALWAN